MTTQRNFQVAQQIVRLNNYCLKNEIPEIFIDQLFSEFFIQMIDERETPAMARCLAIRKYEDDMDICEGLEGN